MFKSGIWKSNNNVTKIKALFKLQFHASQLMQVGGDGLMISVVPADSGKPTVKSDKAPVRGGSCLWENPVYETVKFNQDTKSGKIQERIYHFVIGTGSSRGGAVGEASIDFASYAEATKVSLVSLPLKNSKSEAVLHVSIQRIKESLDQREVEEVVDAKLDAKDQSLRSHLGNNDTDVNIVRRNSVEEVSVHKTASQVAELNGIHRASSGSDVTMSSSESSSGIEAPWTQGPNSGAPTPKYDEHQQSQWEWLGNSNSALEASTDDSSSTPMETFLRQSSEEASDIVLEKLKAELAALSRHAEMSDLELQTLRKQIVKESKRGQDLWREIVCLKEERDALKGECERLRSKTKNNLHFEGVDSRAIVEELRQELNHAKEINDNLRIQLQKTQESNSELILAVQELEEMLEQKNMETSSNNADDKSREGGHAFQSDGEEQKALEELVKDHSDSKESYLLEQQITDLRNEIEIYKRDKDELEMQMEQLALDYEIMKQENHEMSYKLEQSQIQEQLKMQYECSSPNPNIQDLETHIENLENELKQRSEESEDLEARVKNLEEELEKQAQVFEADLESLTRSKIEQEQRAIKAEEMLRRIRWKNANTAERLQEEFRRLSVQLASTFEANEKLATKALSEANGLRLQKAHLETMLQQVDDEHQSTKNQYETRLRQMQLEIEDRALQLENLKKYAEETEKVLTDEISMLRDENETYIAKSKILSEEMESKRILMQELEQMKLSMKEMELLVEQGNDEKIELESRVMLVKQEAEELEEELHKLRHLVNVKELMVRNLQLELDSVQAHCMALKHSLSEEELEKEKLRKQALQLRSDLKKREDALSSMEKKIKDGNGRGNNLDVVKANSRTSKTVPRGSKEVANLKERIKLLEGEIKLKETALETFASTFLEKENDLHVKIKELEGRLEVLNRTSDPVCENDISKALKKATNSTADLDELVNEMTVLKERNRSMEDELKEMQERYSDISLKFAEVEGERQQLVMTLRNIRNANKSP